MVKDKLFWCQGGEMKALIAPFTHYVTADLGERERDPKLIKILSS